MSAISKLKVSARAQENATLMRIIMYSMQNKNLLPSYVEKGGVLVVVTGCKSTWLLPRVQPDELACGARKRALKA